MNRLPLPAELAYETADLIANIKSNDGVACFEVSVDRFNTSTEALNEYVDGMIESGWMLADLSYKPLRVENDEIVFQVIAADSSEWMEEFNS